MNRFIAILILFLALSTTSYASWLYYAVPGGGSAGAPAEETPPDTGEFDILMSDGVTSIHMSDGTTAITESEP